MAGFFTFIFIAAWWTGIVAWFFGIGEIVSIWRFWPWVFGIGICVLRETQMLPMPKRAVGSKFETSHGVFKIVAPDHCLFRPSMRPDIMSQSRSFLIKCSLRWDDNGQVIVEGRIPLSPMLFIAAWLEAWAAFAVLIVLTGRLVPGLGIFFVGWVPVGGMCFFAVRSEIRRVKQLVKEYQDLLVASQVSHKPSAQESR